MTTKIVGLVVVLLAVVHYTYAAGGVAELKSLTGDAPYMGFGNQEQAPEYFGDALYRQYYQNPSYGYAPNYPWSRYQMNAAGSYYNNAYRGGMSPYYASGVNTGVPSVAAVAPISDPVASAAVNPSIGLGNSGGGFYTGRGNDWVKSRK
ncbi:hypothetical protein M3Y95_00399100 [Aphelenchoides besseyi]|nr:hypothetical protein M3Y95_00399100 [Aphelenchoides besseyi]